MSNTAYNMNNNSQHSGSSSRIDFQSITARVKELLTSPDTAWEKIKTEPATINSIYRNYLIILAAIWPVFSFIKGSIIGYSFLGFTVRFSIIDGLIDAILLYGMSLLLPYISAMILEKLAPKFGGSATLTDAFKLVVYAGTPGYLAGVFTIIPALGFLASLVALGYSIYLFFKGLPRLISVPSDRRMGYLATAVVCMIVTGFLLGLVVNAISPANPGDYGNPEINKLEDAVKQWQNSLPKP